MAQQRRKRSEVDDLAPLLVLGVAIVAGVEGARRTSRGRALRDEALRTIEDAQQRHLAAIDQVEVARSRVERRAVAYGAQQVALLRGPLADAVAFLEAIQQRGALKPGGPPVVVRRRLSSSGPYALDPLGVQEALRMLVHAAFAGFAGGQSALALAALVGVAGTGTAIGALSGAAASDAALAWLGGGSLEIGGGGVALGGVVLGGVVLGVALLVVGLNVERQGEEALTQAHAVRAQANERIAACETLIGLLGAVHTRIDELSDVCAALGARLRQTLARLDATRWRADRDEDVRGLQTLLILARTLGEVLRTPVIDASGGLGAASGQVLTAARSLLEEEL